MIGKRLLVYSTNSFLNCLPLPKKLAILKILLSSISDKPLELNFLDENKQIKNHFFNLFRSNVPGFDYLNRSFSQNGEDLIISRILKDHPIGHFIDLGAHHPWRFSNTALLVEKGWVGVNIEADSSAIDSFKEVRRADKNLCRLVGLSGGWSDYYTYSDTALNTSSERRVRYLSEMGINPTSKRRVARTSARKLLEENFNPRTFYCNIDIEGLDIEILSNLNFRNFHPCLLVVEFPLQDLQSTIKLANKVAFLKNYKIVSQAYNSLIFLSKKCDSKHV